MTDRSDREQAEWLADKIGALGDYAKEAAEMLRRWPDEQAAIKAEREACAAAIEAVGPKDGPITIITNAFAAAIRARLDG